VRSPLAAGLVGKVAEAVTLLLLVSVVPRALGPERYGALAFALALVSLASASASLGGPSLMSRFIPAAAAEERAAVARSLARRALRWRALQVALFSAVGAVLAAGRPSRFPPAQTALVVVAIGLDVAATLGFQIGLGLGRTSAWSFRYPVQQGALILAAVTLGRTGGSTGAVGSIAVAAAVALAFGTIGLKPLRGVTPAAVPPGVTRFAVLTGISGLLVQLVHRAPVIAVVVLGGSKAQAGFASLAVGVGLAATYLVWQLFTVELPRLAEQSEGDPRGAEDSMRRLTERMTLVLVPIALVAVPIVRHAIPIVAGDRFRGSLPAIGPALALLPVAPLTALGSQAATLRLRPEERLKSSIAGAVVFVVVAAVLVPGHAALGATIALLAGSAATALAYAFVFRDLFARRLLVEVAAAIAGVLVLGAVS
jgi:O-antigen/teichoic acid export membrane protein